MDGEVYEAFFVVVKGSVVRVGGGPEALGGDLIEDAGKLYDLYVIIDKHADAPIQKEIRARLCAFKQLDTPACYETTPTSLNDLRQYIENVKVADAIVLRSLASCPAFHVIDGLRRPCALSQGHKERHLDFQGRTFLYDPTINMRPPAGETN